MLGLDYKKGQICSREPIICQEGYCSECLIYRNNSFIKNSKAPELEVEIPDLGIKTAGPRKSSRKQSALV